MSLVALHPQPRHPPGPPLLELDPDLQDLRPSPAVSCCGTRGVGSSPLLASVLFRVLTSTWETEPETAQHRQDANSTLLIRGGKWLRESHCPPPQSLHHVALVHPAPSPGGGAGKRPIFQALTQHMQGSPAALSKGFPGPRNKLQRQVEVVISVERNRAPELARRP